VGALLGLVYLATAWPATRVVLGGADGRALIPVLQKVGVAEILYATGLFLGIAFA
jgi:1,4-dihydroxy-2-naphthoate octaprenyltransferase